MNQELLNELCNRGFRELDVRIATDLADKFMNDIADRLTLDAEKLCTNEAQRAVFCFMAVSFMGSYSEDKMPILGNIVRLAAVLEKFDV